MLIRYKAMVFSMAVLLIFHILHAAPVLGAADKEKGTMTVTGEAVEMHAPDTAVISLALETSARSAARAMEENAVKAKRMVATLKAMVDPKKGDSVKTSNFSVNPEHKSYGSGKTGNHRARHSVIVATGRIKEAGAIIDKAMEAGANRVDGVRFTLSSFKGNCKSVMKKAVEDARAKAAEMAALFGVRIAGIKSITPNCGSGGPSPMMEMRAMAASGGPSLESGEVPVRAFVNVTYLIDQ